MQHGFIPDHVPNEKSLVRKLLVKLNNEKVLAIWDTQEWRILIKTAFYFSLIVLLVVAMLFRLMELLLLLLIAWLFYMCFMFAKLGEL